LRSRLMRGSRTTRRTSGSERNSATRSRGTRTNTAFNKVWTEPLTGILRRASSPRSCCCADCMRGRAAICRASGGYCKIRAYSSGRVWATAWPGVPSGDGFQPAFLRSAIALRTPSPLAH
jgi:hypothetical protein